MNKKQQPPKNNWEIWFDEMFPCRHHASQCRGDCNGKIKDFIRDMFEKNVEEGTKKQNMKKPKHDAATSWRRIQNLKFVLLELMIENKKSKKDPIDIMSPYVLRIMEIFGKK